MDKAIKLYLGVAVALVIAGTIWMLADALRTGAIGRVSTLMFLVGLLMIFLPVTIGAAAECIRKRKGGARK